MTNKEWLATLPAEQFYEEWKKAEYKNLFDANTRLALIEWLDKERERDWEKESSIQLKYDGHYKGSLKREIYNEIRRFLDECSFVDLMSIITDVCEDADVDKKFDM